MVSKLNYLKRQIHIVVPSSIAILSLKDKWRRNRRLTRNIDSAFACIMRRYWYRRESLLSARWFKEQCFFKFVCAKISAIFKYSLISTHQDFNDAENLLTRSIYCIFSHTFARRNNSFIYLLVVRVSDVRAQDLAPRLLVHLQMWTHTDAPVHDDISYKLIVNHYGSDDTIYPGEL